MRRRRRSPGALRAPRAAPEGGPYRNVRRGQPWCGDGFGGNRFGMPLPRSGRPAAEILEQLKELQADDVDWKSGRAFSLAYHAGDDVLALASEALTRFQSANALNVAAF